MLRLAWKSLRCQHKGWACVSQAGAGEGCSGRAVFWKRMLGLQLEGMLPQAIFEQQLLTCVYTPSA